jgi:hypothetical protein
MPSTELLALAMDFSSNPELAKLKERFKDWSDCNDKATAAAFGYLAAMEEIKKEKKFMSIYDEVLEQVEDDRGDPCMRTDAIMTNVYYWLDGLLAGEGYDKENYIRALISDWFDSFIVRR